jgi:hypothetical protein
MNIFKHIVSIATLHVRSITKKFFKILFFICLTPVFIPRKIGKQNTDSEHPFSKPFNWTRLLWMNPMGPFTKRDFIWFSKNLNLIFFYHRRRLIRTIHIIQNLSDCFVVYFSGIFPSTQSPCYNSFVYSHGMFLSSSISEILLIK